MATRDVSSNYCLPVVGFQEINGGYTQWTINLCANQTLHVGTCALRGASSQGPTSIMLLDGTGRVVAADRYTVASSSVRLPALTAVTSSAVLAWNGQNYVGMQPINQGFADNALLNMTAPVTSAGCGAAAGAFFSYAVPPSVSVATPYTLRLACRGRSATPDARGNFFYPYACRGNLTYTVIGGQACAAAPPQPGGVGTAEQAPQEPPQPRAPPSPPLSPPPAAPALGCLNWPQSCANGTSGPCQHPVTLVCGSTRPTGECVSRAHVLCTALTSAPSSSGPPAVSNMLRWSLAPVGNGSNARARLIGVSSDVPALWLDWPTAHSTCLSFGGALATVSSPADASFLYSIAPGRSYWIGLMDTVNPDPLMLGEWLWSSGSVMLWDRGWCGGFPGAVPGMTGSYGMMFGRGAANTSDPGGAIISAYMTRAGQSGCTGSGSWTNPQATLPTTGGATGGAGSQLGAWLASANASVVAMLSQHVFTAKRPYICEAPAPPQSPPQSPPPPLPLSPFRPPPPPSPLPPPLSSPPRPPPPRPPVAASPTAGRRRRRASRALRMAAQS